MPEWNFEPVVIGPPTLLPTPEQTRGFRLHLQLLDTDPLVWRRIEVPGNIMLPDLHHVVQASMGWMDSHLHQFRTGPGHRSPAFLNDFAVAEGESGIPERDVRLDQVLGAVGDAIWYEYDFGDSWEHRLTVESVLGEPPAQARCTAAELACPPEDCGGVGGYAEWARWARAGCTDDTAPEFVSEPVQARAWLPDGWHPDSVDLPAINAELALLGATPVTVRGEFAELADRVGRHPRSPFGQVLRAAAFDGVSEVTDAEAADLTQPFRTFLEVIGDGTPLTAAKRLKPAVVREVAERLGITEWWIGLCNREDQTLPVMMIREATRDLGLVSVRKGVLAPTVAARKAVEDPAALLRHVVSRLPIGKERADREAGWLTVAVIGGELDPQSWNRLISEGLYDAGWRSSSAPDVPPPAHNPTLDVINIMNGGTGPWHAVTVAEPGLSAMARMVAVGPRDTTSR